MERAHTGEEERRPRLVVAVDGSKGSAQALRWSAWLATVSQAEVIAVHALPRPVSAGGYAPWMMGMSSSDWQDTWRGWADHVGEKLEREWCEPLREAGVGYRTVVIQGGVSDLISYVQEQGADFMIVGRRGLGGFAELVIGSFSQQLIHHSPIPVLVVPADRAIMGEAEEHIGSAAASNV